MRRLFRETVAALDPDARQPLCGGAMHLQCSSGPMPARRWRPGPLAAGIGARRCVARIRAARTLVPVATAACACLSRRLSRAQGRISAPFALEVINRALSSHHQLFRTVCPFRFLLRERCCALVLKTSKQPNQEKQGTFIGAATSTCTRPKVEAGRQSSVSLRVQHQPNTYVGDAKAPCNQRQ